MCGGCIGVDSDCGALPRCLICKLFSVISTDSEGSVRSGRSFGDEAAGGEIIEWVGNMGAIVC